MVEKRSFDVFLHYSRIDEVHVERLACVLEDDENLRVWLDTWNLLPGDPLQEEIEKALDSPGACVVFSGVGAWGPWQHEEMRLALEMRVRRAAFRVIPVLLPGARLPEPGDLPPLLSRLG